MKPISMVVQSLSFPKVAYVMTKRSNYCSSVISSPEVCRIIQYVKRLTVNADRPFINKMPLLKSSVGINVDNESSVPDRMSSTIRIGRRRAQLIGAW
jgi:hypothetical protein